MVSILCTALILNGWWEYSLPLHSCSCLPLYMSKHIHMYDFLFFSYHPLLLSVHCFLCPSVLTYYLLSLQKRERHSSHTWGANLPQVRLELSEWTGNLTSAVIWGGGQTCFLHHLWQFFQWRSWRTWGIGHRQGRWWWAKDYVAYFTFLLQASMLKY